jgi:hypothetical protein
MELVTAVAFGALLEWVGVHVLRYYFYDPTPFSLLGVPLSIAAGWGMIIYACMRTSDAIGLVPWARPFLDSLLAVVIDLGMDAVACRLNIWTWTFHPALGRWERDWFGVPFGNFYAWIFVVLFYSALMRAFRKRAIARRAAGGETRALMLAAPLVCSMLSEVGVYALIQFGFFLRGLHVPDDVVMAWPWLLVGVPGLWAAARRVGLGPVRALDWPCYAVPAFFHLYSFALLALTAMPHVDATLWWASLFVLTGALALHGWLARPIPGPEGRTAADRAGLNAATRELHGEAAVR